MKPTNPRRNFLKTALRTLAGGGIAATGVVLATRRNPVHEDDCTESFVCQRCGASDSCGLPHAMNYREHRARLTAGGDNSTSS